jgi:hypothetical protein
VFVHRPARRLFPQRPILCLFCLLRICLPLYPQTAGAPAKDDGIKREAGREAAGLQGGQPYLNPANVNPFELLTFKISDLFNRFGPPVSVYAVRGEQSWQDDVVLEYAEVDFYLFKDQVWQVSLPKAQGIAKGDPEKAIDLVFQNLARKGANFYTVLFNERPWPMELRMNIGKNGKVSAIYLYRLKY